MLRRASLFALVPVLLAVDDHLRDPDRSLHRRPAPARPRITPRAGVEKGGGMMQPFDMVIARLERHRGVVGVMLVGVDDGMVIAGSAGAGRDSDTAAALAASLFRRTRMASVDAGLGEATFVGLEADRGHVCATARGDIVIVAVTSTAINLGKLRLEMLGAAEML